MTNQVLVTVGVDGSTASSVALGWAAREAAHRGGALRVVHSYSVPIYGMGATPALAMPTIDFAAYQQTHTELTNNQLAPIRRQYPNLEVDCVVTNANARTSIIEEAGDSELVVVGSHGTGPLAGLVLGSVAHAVAHKAPCPAVLVPEGSLKTQIDNIVVGVDGSPASSAAVKWAASEAMLWDAHLTLVHAWDYPYSDLRNGPVMPSELMELDAARVLKLELRELNHSHQIPERLSTRLLFGSPAGALIAIAAEADLLVVGARGRGAVRSALLGSTSSYAIHYARCPIAIIHAEAAT
jgi:nucleotide-binding universal stress UspA family protein